MAEVQDDGEFGLNVDMPDYESFDGIEDIFIESHDIAPIGAQFQNDLGAEVGRLWFDHSVGKEVVQNIVDQFFRDNS